MRDDKDMRRLAEIDANLLRSPLTRLERLEHLAERKRLCDEIYGTTKKRRKDFKVGQRIVQL